MSSFRVRKTVLTERIGDYVDGVWVSGARAVTSALMSVQPLDAGALQDLQPMPEARHLSDYVKIYTSKPLKTSQDGGNQQPDIVVSNGFGYEVTAASYYQSDVISHYKYVGVKVFKFTNNASWLSGDLKRP